MDIQQKIFVGSRRIFFCLSFQFAESAAYEVCYIFSKKILEKLQVFEFLKVFLKKLKIIV